MIRFKLVEEEHWCRNYDDTLSFFICFDEETDVEITKQFWGFEDIGTVRTSEVVICYSKETDTFEFEEINLAETDEEQDDFDRYFGKDEWLNRITFTFNNEELKFLKDSLPKIEKQIEENEKKPYVPKEDSIWDDDFLR